MAEQISHSGFCYSYSKDDVDLLFLNCHDTLFTGYMLTAKSF